MRIRPASQADAAALAAIYGHHVAHGFGTFEEVAPDADEMAARLAAVTRRGLPYLVAEIDGAVAGFAYAGPFRARAAYRYTVEDSVYIAHGRQGQGVGKALLGAVIAACEPLGLRQMVAMIGDSANAGSIGLHRSCGFAHAGVLGAVGFKAGRWVDVVMMQRGLGPGADQPPGPGGLELSES
ncbi:MAG: GNAT family N-acetyltransferase [Caulobacteraceae bacterium]|nr:GNAT family N-acetyltransferase [Caulobacteraceae bacterium]